MTWVFLGCAIVAEVTATLSLKGSQSVPLLYVAVVAGYVASFALLAMVLRRGMNLGVAYGIWGAAGVALTALFSALLFGEALTALMAVGLALIIGGVFLIESGSSARATTSTSTHDR